MGSCVVENPFTEIKIFSQHKDIVRFLVRIDDYRFCSASDDGNIAVWDFRLGKLLYCLSGHTRPVTAVCPISKRDESSASGSTVRWFVVSASSDKLIVVWDINSGQMLKRFIEHGSTAKCLSVMPNVEGYFCSGGEKLCLWNAVGQHLVDMTAAMTVEDIHLLLVLPDGTVVTAADKTIAVYQCNTPKDVSSPCLEFSLQFDAHRECIRSLIKINDESFVSGSLDGAIIQWSIQKMEIIRRFNFVEDYEGSSHHYPRSVQSVTCIDGMYLLCAVGSGFSVYSCQTGETLLDKANVHDGKVLGVVPAFYGYMLVTYSEDGTIKLWGNHDVLSGQQQLLGEPSALKPDTSQNEAAFLRNFGTRDGKLVLREVGVCAAHSGPVQCCLPLPLGRFASCGMDAVIILWMDGLAESCHHDRTIRDAVFNISSSNCSSRRTD